MSLKITNAASLRLLQDVCIASLKPAVVSANLEIIRYAHSKHWSPKWKFFRRLKVMPVELPKFHENIGKLSDDEVAQRLKKQGILPPRPWVERQVFIHSTGGIFEAYVPPEGDGKVSPITKQGAMQSVRFLEKKTKTMMAIRKIRQFDEEFDTPDFCKEASKFYIKMHEMMTNSNKDDIIDVVTERAYPEVLHNIKNKTIQWKFIKEVELPRVVQARCTDVITKDNIFAQLTVRFHTQQILAIYDRFGRLMHGSPITAKDVLEYVVFEKNISNEYGTWRIHAKIIPDWLPPREPTRITFKKKIDSEEKKESEIPNSETKVIEQNKEGERLALA